MSVKVPTCVPAVLVCVAVSVVVPVCVAVNPSFSNVADGCPVVGSVPGNCGNVEATGGLLEIHAHDAPAVTGNWA